MVATIGCIAAPTAESYPWAVARAGCTQEDISGVEVFLTREPWVVGGSVRPPYIRIEVARPRVGERLVTELSPLKRDPVARVLARAALHPVHGSPIWLSGTLSFERRETTREVEGSYSFCTEERRCFAGGYSAPWIEGTARCG